MQSDLAKHAFFQARTSNVPTGEEDEKNIGKKWKIYTWGKDNLYPQFLNQLFFNNSIHSGIIRSKVHYITSGGLEYEPLDENDTNELAQWKLFFDNDLSDYDLNELMAKLALDYELSNKFIVHGRWSRDFTRVEKLDIIDFEKGRKIIDSTMLVTSEDWSDKRQNLKYYGVLDLECKANEEKQTRQHREFYLEYQEKPKQQLMKGSTSNLSHGIYPLPPYSGGIRSILTGIEIDEYQNAEIMNGFSLGTIINLNNGEPKNKEDKASLERGIRGSATGASSANGTMILYNNGKDREATVVNLNGNDLNNRYIEVNKDTQKNILRSHSVTTPILFGFKEEGSLGNATELEIGYSIMKANYFKSRQSALLSVINYIADKCNDLPGKIKFKEVELNLPGEETTEPSVVINNKFGDDFSSSEALATQERLLAHFEKFGSSKDSVDVLFRHEVKDHENITESEAFGAFLDHFKFAELSEVQGTVLSLISEGNDFDNIRKATELSSKDLARVYQDLISLDLIADDGQLTRSGKRQIVAEEISKMRIVYSYEVRAGYGEPVIETTRDFCRRLIQLDRVYSRDDINTISSIEGRNVFLFKGGWYHDPSQNKTFPFCRHTWVQNVIFDA